MQQIKIHQNGQVLPLTAMFLLVIFSTTLFMFNSMQLVQEKVRLVNATDAALYAGAVQTARILNYQAYTNKSVIMNHVSIAQGISLISWVTHTAKAAEEIGDYVDYINPAVGGIIKQGRWIQSYYLPYLNAAIVRHDLVIQSLHYHAEEMISGWDAKDPGMSAESTESAPDDLGGRMLYMRKILGMNYLDKEFSSKTEEDHYTAHMDTKPLEDNFKEFIHEWGNKAERQRMGKVIMAELNDPAQKEEFVLNRGWDLSFEMPVSSLLGSTMKKMGLVKRGGTELIDNADGWVAMDTLSVHFGGEIPIGYATAESNSNVEGARGSYGRSRTDNPAAYRKAQGNQAPGWPDRQYKADKDGDWTDLNPKATPFGAVHSYIDLSTEYQAKDDPIVKVTAVAYRKVTATRTSAGTSTANSNSVKPAGRLELYQGNARDNKNAEMLAVSSYEVYWEREDRKDGRTEMASTFNPYWRYRLVEPTKEMRRKAQTHRGGSLVTPL